MWNGNTTYNIQGSSQSIGALTVAGGTLTSGASGALTGGGGAQVVSVPVELQSNLTITNNATGAVLSARQSELRSVGGHEIGGAVLVERDALSRQRVIATVQELLAEAEQAAARVQRPEDFAAAILPLDAAGRVVDVARVLAPEEQERLREGILVERNQIQSQLARAQADYQSAAHQEVAYQEAARRSAPAGPTPQPSSSNSGSRPPDTARPTRSARRSTMSTASWL